MKQDATYKLIISYDGTLFKGWQRQGNLPTIQLELEKVVARCWGQEISVQGSGRTDTGVHALGQVAHFRAQKKHQPAVVVRALNDHLPREIRIVKCQICPEHFHARFSATGKEYRYRVVNDPVFPPFEINHAHHVPRSLDVKDMREASEFLIGEHDFSSFTSNPGYARTSMVRDLQKITIQKNGSNIIFRFRGNGFLYRMVRNIMGTLIQVGLGRMEVKQVKKILDAKTRQSAPNTAPACGLYLMRVFYGNQKTDVDESDE